ncbi:thermosome subunit [Candidatus Woesearchaeota archaeon]|nr:thermosome subunit [Candidatus Woesearchaeota archaeon]
MMNDQVQPIFILPEGSSRNTGKLAQKANIAAAKAISDTVRTTLGPKGMDKMLVSANNDVTITNDGVTILDEMQIEHPAAKMIVEVAKVQEEEVGDGTTTAVVIAGELLHASESLLDKNIHPTVIADGYKLAAQRAQSILQAIGMDIDITNKLTLKNIAMTAMTGKNVEWAKGKLAEIAVKAVLHVAENNKVDMDNIKIEKKEGGGSADTELIDGVVLDKERIHSDMPKRVANAKIALLDTAIEVKNTEIEAKIQITDPNQLQAFLDSEEKTLKAYVDAISNAGASVVFCSKGIDDLAQHFLAQKGIYTVRRVTQSDIIKLSKATGSKIVSKINEIKPTDLGKSGLVEEKKLGDENMTYVTKCLNPKAVTAIIRGGTAHVVDEVERALKDAIGDLSAALSNGKCVAGGGAVEVELAKELRKYADSLSGREQLAVQAFSEALEMIPRTLAENAGLDPIDMLTALKSEHDAGKKWVGLNVFSGQTQDMWQAGVIEPLKIKTQAIQSATEAAILILRIDGIISSGKSNQQQMPPHNMPQGMM